MIEPDFVPELPPRVAPDAVQKALDSLDGDVAEFLSGLASRGGVLVEPGPTDDTCTVTFAREVVDSRESAAVLIDTITHMRRDRLDHFILEKRDYGGVELHVAAFVLPNRLRATTSLLIECDFDVRVAEERASWRAVYGRTTSLSDQVEIVRSVGGGTATVLALPDALPAPHADAEATGTIVPGRGGADISRSTVHHDVIFSAALGMPMRVIAFVPSIAYGAATALLIAADADRLFDEYPLRPGLDRLHASGTIEPTLVLLFAPEDHTRRAQVLGMNPDLADFFAQELLPWAAGFSPVPTAPARRAVAGASLGGLAAADVVRRAPDIIANAVVQSGSFWWPANDVVEAEGLQLRLWEREGEALAERGVRIFQEVGDQERHLLHGNRTFCDIARRAGIDIAYREYVGGHDFACWRGGVLDALVHLFPAPALPSSQGQQA